MYAAILRACRSIRPATAANVLAAVALESHTFSEILSATHLSRSALSGNLDRLVDQGFLRREGSWYVLRPEGFSSEEFEEEDYELHKPAVRAGPSTKNGLTTCHVVVHDETSSNFELEASVDPQQHRSSGLGIGPCGVVERVVGRVMGVVPGFNPAPYDSVADMVAATVSDADHWLATLEYIECYPERVVNPPAFLRSFVRTHRSPRIDLADRRGRVVGKGREGRLVGG